MWATVVEADAYFEDSLESSSWQSLATKSAALNSSYRVLSSHPGYAFPDTVTQKMKDANSEHALYLATTSTKRQSLREQGVKSFTVGQFSETLSDSDDGYGTKVVLPSIVKQLLDEYEIGPQFVGFINR